VLHRLIANLGLEAGIGRLYPHPWRHTFAAMFLRGRGDAFTSQAVLGHESLAVTRLYVELAAADLDQTYRSPLDSLSP
jgi:integrase/recombinase XerD